MVSVGVAAMGKGRACVLFLLLLLAASPLETSSSCLGFVSSLSFSTRRRAAAATGRGSITACEGASPSPSGMKAVSAPSSSSSAVLNFRDLSDAGGGVAAGKVFRTANLQAAYAPEEVSRGLCERWGIGVVLDLRSEDEMLSDRPHEGMRRTLKFERKGSPDGEPPLGLDPGKGMLKYVVPLMERGAIAKGLFGDLSLMDKAKMALYGLVDSSKQQAFFIQKMNEGGLLGLSILMIDNCQPELCFALKVVADCASRGIPVAFQCRLGKDRTVQSPFPGLIAALVLLCAGANDDDVVNDYVLSDGTDGVALGAVQSEMEKVKKGPRLDRTRFQGAKAETMRGIMSHLRDRHGTAETYLDKIGFDQGWRDKLVQGVK